MKKITLMLLVFLAAAQHSFAQLEFSGSPQYGRLTNFVYDAAIKNKVYASTLSKHIMTSTNNGVSWNVLYTPALTNYDPIIKDMKLAKNGTALSFVEYYGPGSSLNKLKVIDIITVTVIKEYSMPEITAGRNFNKYEIFNDGTLNTVMLLASGSDDKVFYTTNGGTNWTTVYDNANDEDVIVNNITIDPSNAAKLYIARNGGAGNVDGGLLVSANAGQTWTLTLDGLILQTVVVNPSNSNDILVGTGVRWAYLDQEEALYRSLDGGLTWNIIPLVWNQYAALGGYCAIFSITFNPTDPTNIVVLEDNQIIRTVDNGVTWQNTIYEGYPSPATFNYYIPTGLAINPTDKNEMLINNTWYPLRSTDGGLTTTILSNPYFNATRDMNLVDLSGEQHLYYGAQWGYVNRNLVTNTETTTDMLAIDEVPMGEGGYKMVADKNIPGRVYTYQGGWMGNSINVSNDHGVTKDVIYSTFDQLMTAAVTDSNNTKIGWFATFDGVNCFLRKIDFTDLTNPLVTDITLPVNNDYLNCVLIDKTDSNKIIITVGAELYKTTDGGTTWTLITNGLSDLQLPNIGITMEYNPLNANQITMGASNGIYTSLDGGTTWSRIYESFVSKVWHSTKTGGDIVAVVQTLYDIDAKIIFSTDGGTTWTEKTSNEFFHAIVTSSAVKFDGDSADVYLGTTDLGVIKMKVNFEGLSTPEFGNGLNSILIYPNPTSEVLNIRANNNATIETVEIFNNLGQQVLNSKNKSTINVSGLSNGIYYIKVKDSNNNTGTQKLIKQ
ncbi:T9SS type A sorting domain-containing protein [Flavobacterium cerinum]|uniref:T9SS type A sorting domain-containing protein n=1 Tax=Flavobacterium cerinum TaxID=2502784 RepID=A0A444HCN8_9FLAO|nr:T9SS type A sorting domain-containing protein [Flavobacterium cerinum]RWX01538.1 T9SS type A sorting domain-containing protein [Flavobacterium cerinum]